MRVVAGFLAVSLFAPGAAWADTTTERLIRMLEDQQTIIREQHQALMQLLRERDTPRPHIPVAAHAPAPLPAPPRLQVASTAPAPRQLVAGGAGTPVTAEPKPHWYAAIAGTVSAPNSAKTNPTDDCVFTSVSNLSSFANATSCDTFRQSTRSLDVDTGPGYGGTASVGYRVFEWLRAEGQIGFDMIGIDRIREQTNAPVRSNREAEGRALLLTGLANVYADIPTGTLVTPYVGAGLGGFHAAAQGIREKDRPNGDTLDDSAFGVAIAGMAGAEFAFDEHWSATLGYRYLLLPDVSAMTRKQRKGDATLDFHQFQLGLRRYF